MSLKCLSRLLYMEPRESGSYSVPSFLSTHRKNLAIILSRSLGGIPYLSRCSILILTWVGIILRCKILTNIMPTHVKISIEPGIRELFLKNIMIQEPHYQHTYVISNIMYIHVIVLIFKICFPLIIANIVYSLICNITLLIIIFCYINLGFI